MTGSFPLLAVPYTDVSNVIFSPFGPAVVGQNPCLPALPVLGFPTVGGPFISICPPLFFYCIWMETGFNFRENGTFFRIPSPSRSPGGYPPYLFVGRSSLFPFFLCLVLADHFPFPPSSISFAWRLFFFYLAVLGKSPSLPLPPLSPSRALSRHAGRGCSGKSRFLR